jgi:hypothetical protein
MEKILTQEEINTMNNTMTQIGNLIIVANS